MQEFRVSGLPVQASLETVRNPRSCAVSVCACHRNTPIQLDSGLSHPVEVVKKREPPAGSRRAASFFPSWSFSLSQRRMQRWSEMATSKKNLTGKECAGGR
uniref:Uncharacterized protein n=1 Tax=Micrurus lemniscatus lemniscatus TaxID=129467 RepID=A0A2D4H8K4_MICLE